MLSENLQTIVSRYTEDLRIAGASFAVRCHDETAGGFSGVTRWDGAGQPVTLDTWFDLASLTKVILTVPAVLTLVQDQVWTLETRLGDVLRQAPDPLADVTVKQLLTHSAGLPSGFPEIQPPGEEADIRRSILGIVPSPCPGESRYSDVGMFLLGWMCEATTRRPLFDWVNERVFGVLGLDFRTGVDPQRDLVAATRVCPVRQRVVQGEAQNLVTYRLGRAAGHAGLFGTAAGVLQYGRSWLDRAGLPWSTKLSDLAVETWLPGRGLGWMRPGCPQFIASVAWPEDTFGHTGYTGTALVISPSARLVGVCLTNRTHALTVGQPDDQAIRTLRQAFYGEVLRGCGQ